MDEYSVVQVAHLFEARCNNVAIGGLCNTYNAAYERIREYKSHRLQEISNNAMRGRHSEPLPPKYERTAYLKLPSGLWPKLDRDVARLVYNCIYNSAL